MLDLGVPGALAVLGAISAAHHGQAIFFANCAQRRGYYWYVDRYVGIVRNMGGEMSRRTIGVKLVFCLY